MIAADLAGDRTRADAYKRELEELRAAKGDGKVVALETRRRGTL